MKKRSISLVILLICSLRLIAQTYEVKLFITNCVTGIDGFEDPNLRIYKSDSLIKENISFAERSLWGFQLTGTYGARFILRYTNIFKQPIERDIEIDSVIKEIILCNDTFVDTKERTLIEGLSNNDRLEFTYSSQGCFHSFNERLLLRFKKNKLIAEYFFGKKRKRTIIIDRTSLTELIKFERELRCMEDGGYCTTTDFYTVLLNGTCKLNLKDATCVWGGFFSLKKKIFTLKN